jgi:hypothetical protein
VAARRLAGRRGAGTVTNMDTTAAIPGFTPVRSARLGWRRFTDFAVETPSSMFVHVRDGRVAGIGIEPLGDVLVALDGTVTRLLDGGRGNLDRVRVAVTAGVGATIAAAAAAGAATLAHHRRGATS